MLQSLGAYISKYWMVEVHELLSHTSIKYKQLAYIHDELEIECLEEDAIIVANIMSQAATLASKKIGIRMRIDAESKIGLNWLEVH